MMHRFFEKHVKHLGNEDALSMIKDQIKEACKDYEKGKDHLYHAYKALEMLEDYFEVHGTKPEMHKVDKD